MFICDGCDGWFSGACDMFEPYCDECQQYSECEQEDRNERLAQLAKEQYEEQND